MRGFRRRMVAGAVLAAVSVFAQSGIVSAGPLAEAAAKAEGLAASGDAVGAHDVMRQAISDFSESLPFSLGKAVFVKSDPAGYAMYEPKEAPVFKAGESLISYVEPVGLSWKQSAVQGKIETHFTVDFDILNPAGDVLAGQKAFGDFTFTGFFRNQEIYSTLTIDVSGAPAGDYILRFHFNDVNSGKSTSIDQPFKIAAN